MIFSNGGIPSMGTGSGIPTTYGNYWFVDANTSTPGNGKGMKRPFKYIGQAYAAAANNNHDVILLSANSGLQTQSTSGDGTGTSVDDQLAITKGRLHFVGLGGGSRYYGQRSRWTMGVTTASGGAIAVVKNTGVGNTFTNIKFDSSDTESTSKYVFAEGGEYTELVNFELFQSGQEGVATAAQLLSNGDSSYFHNGMIGSLTNDNAWTAAGSNVVLTADTMGVQKVSRDVIFQDVKFFHNTTITTSSAVHATTAGDIERTMIFNDCIFINALLSTNDPADVFIFDSVQTKGQCLLTGNTAHIGFDDWINATGRGLFSNLAPVPASATTNGQMLDMGGS